MMSAQSELPSLPCGEAAASQSHEIYLDSISIQLPTPSFAPDSILLFVSSLRSYFLLLSWLCGATPSGGELRSQHGAFNVLARRGRRLIASIIMPFILF